MQKFNQKAGGVVILFFGGVIYFQMRHIFNLFLFAFFMLFWTHLVVGLFGIFLYLPYSENPWVFFFIALISSVLPDIDSSRSRVGRNGFSRTLMAFFRHRGVVHSLLFMFFLYLILLRIWRVAAFPFLFGYSIHLFLDCFTIRGVKLFYPLKKRFKFFIRSGGKFERVIFILFLILDCFLFTGFLVFI